MTFWMVDLLFAAIRSLREAPGYTERDMRRKNYRGNVTLKEKVISL
jgi:hypothetical protein